ncbi:hypothetical protein AA0113_g1058 [Alternaria arborescens]|uniref:Uncharacterized protein n=1 Tax=Alternaria arborescens TaxID=156630 RepID=A0A4Q4SNV0_9PLEO|nr:hypothetical protein AA0113_g1058 [Alternaria arborescens]
MGNQASSAYGTPTVVQSTPMPLTGQIGKKMHRGSHQDYRGSSSRRPRCHRCLAQLTIYFKISIRDVAVPDPEKGYWEDPTLQAWTCISTLTSSPSDYAAITPADTRKIQQAMQGEVSDVYQKMRSL